MDNFRCGFNVLQDTLQGHILAGNPCFRGLAIKCKVSLYKMSINVTEEPMLLHIRNTVKDAVRSFILRRISPVTLPIMTNSEKMAFGGGCCYL